MIQRAQLVGGGVTFCVEGACRGDPPSGLGVIGGGADASGKRHTFVVMCECHKLVQTDADDPLISFPFHL